MRDRLDQGTDVLEVVVEVVIVARHDVALVAKQLASLVPRVERPAQFADPRPRLVWVRTAIASDEGPTHERRWCVPHVGADLARAARQ